MKPVSTLDELFSPPPVFLPTDDPDAETYSAFGILPDDLSASGAEQTRSVFEKIGRLLAARGMNFRDHVVRTWLYLDRVNDWYAEFNAARTAFFEEEGVFDAFLPASTGIGHANAAGAKISAGFVAMKPKTDRAVRRIVESPLQEPAMAYRSSFSRAAEIETSCSRTLFVSGTASIEPHSHEVAHVGDVNGQIDCTMKAVRAILASRRFDWKDVSRAIVYLKEPAFLADWDAWCEAHGLPESFAVPIVADVCRPDWLFEIELDARG